MRITGMKTTVDIPDQLLISAKKRAVELRKPLRELVIEGLKREVKEQSTPKPPLKKTIRWVVHPGGLPTDLDISDRAAMTDWIRSHS